LRRGNLQPHALWIRLPRRKAAPRNDSHAMLNSHSRRAGSRPVRSSQ